MISLALLLTSAVSGCNDGRGAINVSTSIDSFCVTQKPIRRTKAEIASLSQDQVDDDLEFNEYGARHCGWKP
jgi:hypothetical protein